MLGLCLNWLAKKCDEGEFLIGFDESGDILCSSSSGLPPDPGASGKSTLEGIDSDNDGLRDDVQIAIFRRYPDDTVKQAALGQGTTALQESLVAGNVADDELIFQAASMVLRAVDCVPVTMDDSSAEISFIKEAIVNTPERSAAYVAFNQALDGQFFGGSDSGNPCE